MSNLSLIKKNNSSVQHIKRSGTTKVFRVFKGSTKVFDDTVVTGYYADGDYVNGYTIKEKLQVGSKSYESGETLSYTSADSTETIIYNQKKYYKAYITVNYQDGTTELTTLFVLGTYIEDVTQYIKVDLLNNWDISTVRSADTNTYTTFMSSSNKGINNGYANMKVTFFGFDSLDVLYGSYAEGSYDYTMVFKIDTDISLTTNYSSDNSLVYACSYAKQSASAPNLTASFSGLDANTEHYFYVQFRKDASANTNDDRGYVALPKEYISEITNPYTNS